MNLEPSDAPLLDSNCRACKSRDGTVWPASASVSFPDGTRRYYCLKHAVEVLRFGADPNNIDDQPLCIECSECGRLTLREDSSINRICRGCDGDDAIISEEGLVELAEKINQGVPVFEDEQSPGGGGADTEANR